jgi:hypothetical protein
VQLPLNIDMASWSLYKVHPCPTITNYNNLVLTSKSKSKDSPFNKDVVDHWN